MQNIKDRAPIAHITFSSRMEGRLSVVIAVVLALSARCGAQSDEQLAALCSQIGVVPHPSDSAKFLTCARTQEGFVARVRTCGKGKTFDGSSCVTANEAPSKLKLIRLSGEPTQDECENKTLNCADCNTLIRCRKYSNGSYVKISTINCIGLKSHCNLGKCSDTISEKCKISSFRCQIDMPGIFPDTSNCKGFYICDGKSDEPLYKSCDNSKPYFSSIQNDCIATNEECSIVSCNNSLGYRAYEADPRFYVFCDPDEIIKIDMYKCPGESKLKLISDYEVECTGCTSAGKIPLPDPLPNPLPKEYEGKDHLVCAKKNDMNPVPSKCPEGLKFDIRFNRCDLPGEVENCKTRKI